MRKSNEHKKMYSEDKFGRRFYCQHARLNLVRSEKRIGKRKTRRESKKLEKETIDIEKNT